MAQGTDNNGRARGSGALVARRDRAYLLALLIPVSLYELALKAAGIASQEESAGLLRTVSLMRSDLLFVAGFASLWFGVFALVRRGVARRLAFVSLHALSLLVVAVSTVAYQYLRSTGSTLDWNVAAYYVATLGEMKDVILGSTPFYAWVVLGAALLYAVFGPRLAVGLLERGRPRTGGAPAASRLGAAGLCLMAAGLGALSLFPSGAEAERSYSLDPVVNLLFTGFSTPDAGTLTSETAPQAAASLAKARLKETPETDRRNVVFIVLDSTRSRSVTPYNEDLKTTPFMDKLAEKSLLVERAYTTTPHTSKAMTSINCGVYPDPETDIHEAVPGAVPVRCLPKLLREQGYKSVWFQSATEKFEDRPNLVENLGYGDFYGLEDMDREGFQRAGYLGYEDDIMLEPSRKWLTKNGKKGPFLATYLTITAHHEYLAPDKRYGRKQFAKDDIFNRYLNGVRYEDFFVKNVIEQYKELGLYEDTIFVIVGDHGEAFGEHKVKGHDGVPYEEGTRVPLIIHDPRRWQDGARLGGGAPVNHLDLAPTVLDMLGFEVTGGEYPGRSILAPPVPRTLFTGCRPDLLCSTSTKGDKKYIYNFGKKPDEYYDLSKDPLEKNDIAAQVPPGELKARRDEVLKWRSGAAALYDD